MLAVTCLGHSGRSRDQQTLKDLAFLRQPDKKKEEEKDGGKSFRIFIVFSNFSLDIHKVRKLERFSKFSFLKVFIFVMVIMALFYIYFFSIKKIIYIDREKWRWRQSSIQNVWWQWWRQWQRVFKKFIYTKVSYI